MRVLGMFVIFAMLSLNAMAACVGTITDVRQDTIKGCLVIDVQFDVEGAFYSTETIIVDITGGKNEVIDRALSKVQARCSEIILEIPENRKFLIEEKQKQFKIKVLEKIAEIEFDLEGGYVSVDVVEKDYRGKKIKIKSDKNNEVIDL